jgi:DNA-binding transcriptional ArsR family regulator
MENKYIFTNSPTQEQGVFKQIKAKHIKMLKVLSYVGEHPGATIYEVSEGLGVSYKTAQRYLRELRGRGKLIARLGGKENYQKFYVNGIENIKINEVLSILKELLKSIHEEGRIANTDRIH